MTQSKRITELEAELFAKEELYREEQNCRDSAEDHIAELEAVLSETVPVMQRSLDYLEDFAKPMPPVLQLALINTIIRASEAVMQEGEK